MESLPPPSLEFEEKKGGKKRGKWRKSELCFQILGRYAIRGGERGGELLADIFSPHPPLRL